MDPVACGWMYTEAVHTLEKAIQSQKPQEALSMVKLLLEWMKEDRKSPSVEKEKRALQDLQKALQESERD